MEQIEIAVKVVEVLESLGISYMFAGSYGSGAWGEPRFTRDMDIVVDLSGADVGRLVAAFPPSDYYVSREAAMDAVAHGGQFNLIHGASGNKVDLIIAGRDEWGRTQLARRRRIQLPSGLTSYVAAPDDIIISKMAYYREGGSEKHLRDIAGIMKVSGDAVDRAYVSRWAGQLGLSEIWQAILRRLGETD